MIKFEETPQGYMVVTGPYPEMAPILSKLKSRGLKYNPGNRSWSARKEDLTPKQLQNLQKLVDATNGVPTGKPEEKQKEEQKQEALKLFQEVCRDKFFGISFRLQTEDILHMQGATFDVNAEAKAAGGTWVDSFKMWVFHADKINLPKFHHLRITVDQVTKRKAVQVTQIVNYLTPPKNWPTIDITVKAYNGLLCFWGNTKPIKDYLYKKFPGLHWVSTNWEVPLSRVTLKQLEDVVKDLDQDEAVALKEKEQTPAEKVVERVAPKGRPNAKPGNCRTCGGWVGVGNGYIFEIYDDEKADMRWVVKHKDPKVCEQIKEEARIRQQEAQNKQQALRNLRNHCDKPEYYAPGKNLKPQGKHVEIDEHNALYGGGDWLVIEPGEQHFWYVRNNGSDGADWSQNNVSTGGAGAMGYRLPMTEEARVLIEVATGEKMTP